MKFDNEVIQRSVDNDEIFKLIRRISICYQAPSVEKTYGELVDYMLDSYNEYSIKFDLYKSKIMGLQDTLEKAREDFMAYKTIEDRIK